MTIRTLKNYREMLLEKQQLAETLEKIESELYGVRKQAITGMPSVVAEGWEETMIGKQEEIIHSFRKKITDTEEELLRIELAIEALQNQTERVILRLRYIDGMKWDCIAHHIHYSVQHTKRIHARALENLRKIEPKV